MAFSIRRLARDEPSLLKTVRLAALQDAPEQFGETLAEASARTPDGWLELTSSVTPPSVQAAYVAENDGKAVGVAFALEDRTDPTIGRLGGMWVASSSRRMGLGAALVEAVLSWAVAEGKRRVRLWVVPNTAGEGLYRRAGFVPTGEQKRFPRDEHRSVIEMQFEVKGCLEGESS